VIKKVFNWLKLGFFFIFFACFNKEESKEGEGVDQMGNGIDDENRAQW